MAEILTHDNPMVQKGLDALRIVGLPCMEVGRRGDQPPGGWVLLVDGSQDTETRRDRLIEAAEALQQEVGKSFIYDALCDSNICEQVLVFLFDGNNSISLALTKPA